MNKAFYIFSFLFISHFNIISQNSVNDYKYIIVPDQFEFLKEKDQYNINSLTKFLFNKYGYQAYMQGEDLPEDLRNDRCLGLMANVVKDAGFLKTKLRIDLKDCNGKLVQSSQIGETRVKEYDKAYNLALRDAFVTFQNLNYVYKPNDKLVSKTVPVTTNVANQEKEEIARLKEEIKTLKEDKIEVVELEKPIQVDKKQVPKVIEIQPEEKIAVALKNVENTTAVLYAQPIENGFQIVDMTPKKVMILYYSGVKDVFIVNGKDAIVYKKGNTWMYAENDGSNLKELVLNIKF
jgi:uncharacterized protein (UPF0335 family)